MPDSTRFETAGKGLARELKIAAVELKLQTRDFAFWSIVALWQAVVIFTLIDNTELSPSAAAWRILGGLVLFTGTAAVLYFVYVLSREESGAMSDLVDAFPHRAQEMVWGKLLGAGVLWSVVGFEVLIMFTVDHLRAGLAMDGLVRAAGYMGATFLAVTVAAAGVGLLCASVMRRSRLAYLGGAVFWVGVLSVLPVLVIEMTDPVRNRWLEVLDPALLRGWSELWGLCPWHDLAWCQDLWLAGLGLALTALAALVYQARRDRDFPRVATAGVLVLAVLAGAAGLTGYFSAYQTRLASVDRQVARYRAGTVSARDAGAPGEAAAPSEVAVTAYDLAFKLGPGHDLAATGTVTVRNIASRPLTELPLTLNQAFAVTKVSATSPTGLDTTGYGREGDFLTVRLARVLQPGTEARLDLAYGGTVWDFMPAATGGDLRLVAGVDRRGVWLPAGYCWCPAGGHQVLARPLRLGAERGAGDWRLVFEPVWFHPARYHLTLSNVRPLALGSSFGPAAAGEPAIIEGTSVTGAGIFVVGAPELAARGTESGLVVAAPALAGAAASVGRQVQAILRAYQLLLPAAVPDSLAVAALPEGILEEGPQSGEGVALHEGHVATTSKVPGQLAILIAEAGLGLEGPVLNLWLGGGPRPGSQRTHSSDPAVEVWFAVRDFTVAAALAETRGSDVFRAALESARSRHPTSTEAAEDDAYLVTLTKLDVLYQGGGRPALRTLLAGIWPGAVAGRVAPREFDAAALAVGKAGAGQ